jgi:hypothetical protein
MKDRCRNKYIQDPLIQIFYSLPLLKFLTIFICLQIPGPMSVTATKTRTTGEEAAGVGSGEEAPSRTLAEEQMTQFR